MRFTPELLSGFITICVVGIDAVAPLGDGELEASGHYVAYVTRGGIQPVLAWPADEGIAIVGWLERRRHQVASPRMIRLEK